MGAKGRQGGAVLGLAIWLAAGAPGMADTSRPEPGPETAAGHGYISVQAENDLFGDGADRHYTHGTQISYFSERCQHEAVARVARALHFLSRDPTDCQNNRVGFALGQAIFTPDDITLPVPDPGDRPYAGWLFVSAGLVAEDDNAVQQLAAGRRVNRTLRKVELSLGVVGPAALAGEVQTEYHELIGAIRPEGWDTQLRNEPALLLSYEVQRRFGTRIGRHLEFDATPHAGLSLGNVFTQGAVGFTLRLGNDMLLDYGPPRIRPSLPGAAFFQEADGIGWYIFAGVEGRAVGRNIFLDGNSFRDGPSVDRRVFVGDAQVGVALTYGRVRLSFTNIYRTREFAGQPAIDEFGAVTASFRL